MISLKSFLEAIEYKITEGSEYLWRCYGDNAYILSSWNGIHGEGGWSADIIFDTKNHTVYEVEIAEYSNNRSYRLIHRDFADKFQAENAAHNSVDGAWDNMIEYIDLDTPEQWISAAAEIITGVRPVVCCNNNCNQGRDCPLRAAAR